MSLTVPVYTFLVTVFFIPTRVPNFCDFFFGDIAESDFGQGKDREEDRERTQREKQVHSESLSCSPTDSWTFTSYLLTGRESKKTTGQFRNLTAIESFWKSDRPDTGNFGYVSGTDTISALVTPLF